MTFLNLLRLIPLVLLVVLFGITFAAISSYIRSQALLKVTHAEDSPVPEHVYKVGLSYLLFVIFAVAEVLSRFNQPIVTWRLPAYAFLGAIGLWALHDLVRWEVMRLRNARTQDRAERLLHSKMTATRPEKAEKVLAEAAKLSEEELEAAENRRERLRYQLEIINRRRRDA